MRRVRVIPVLLLDEGKLIKSVRFKDYTYVGDPINAVKIFNEKEVDEIAILDITATRQKRNPDISLISRIAGEAFMPLAYGGGVTTIDQIKEIFYEGVEKIVLNQSAYTNPELITEAARLFGSQSVVASLDIKRNILGKYRVYTLNGTRNTKVDPVTYARKMEDAGAGEIVLMSIERDGTYKGYDLELISMVSDAVSIPVIASGGAGKVEDLGDVIANTQASAVAAGSIFVFTGPHKAVLINFPDQKKLETYVFSQA